MSHWFSITLVAILVILLGCWLIGFPMLENAYLYRYRRSREAWATRPLTALQTPGLSARIQAIDFKSLDGVNLNAWYLPGDPQKPTVVFAHGNGGNIGLREMVYVSLNHHGYGVLAFDYRGYGTSEGTPSEAGLYRDMTAASRLLTEKYGIPSTHQIAMGESLGSAVAVDAATHIPFRAVVLYASFTSIPEVSRYLRGIGALSPVNTIPLEGLIRQRFDAASKITRIECPILIVHGEADNYIPIEFGRRLFSLVRAPHSRFLAIPGANHGNVFYEGADPILDALDAMLRDSEPAS